MKKLSITLGIIALLFIAFQVYVYFSRNNIEKYPYTVFKEYESFEVRQYDAALFTSVQIPMKEYKKASSSGFRQLAGYIFGGNEKNEKIAMTSPVAMSIEDSMTMMFMVPKKFNKESLPKPNQSSIEFTEIPTKKMAAIRFGGWASDEKIERYKKKLIDELNKKGIKHSSRFSFFGYNPPYDIFFRRNEVVVELDV